jgi:hypothetical protein
MILIVVGSSFWVAIDSHNLEASQTKIKGIRGMDPGQWFACCLLLWIVFFPWYLAVRSTLAREATNR